MKHVMVFLVAALAASRSPAIDVGHVPSELVLEGAAGGRLDGAPWSSAELTNKVHALFYVDPDLKDLNEHVADAIDQKKFPAAVYQSVVVINLAATWKPNWLISTILRHKQKKFPRALFIRDYDRTLVKQWGLADENYDIVLFGPDGRVLASYDGKLSDAQTAEVVRTITAQTEAINTSSPAGE